MKNLKKLSSVTYLGNSKVIMIFTYMYILASFFILSLDFSHVNFQ